jgi:hypothetical protein
MKLTTLIEKLQKIQAEHGNIEVFDANNFSECFLDVVEPDEDEYPSDWNMPAKFLRIGDQP